MPHEVRVAIHVTSLDSLFESKRGGRSVRRSLARVILFVLFAASHVLGPRGASADELSAFISILDKSELSVARSQSDRLPIILWQTPPKLLSALGPEDPNDNLAKSRIFELLKRGVWPAAWLGRTDWGNEPIGCTPEWNYAGKGDPLPCAGRRYYNRFNLGGATRIARAMRHLGYRVPLVMPTIPGADYYLFIDSPKVRAPTTLPNTGGFIDWPSFYKITHKESHEEAARRIRHVAEASGGGKDWILGLFADYESMPYEFNMAWGAQGTPGLRETYPEWMRPMLPIIDPETGKLAKESIRNADVVVSPPGYSFNRWVRALRDGLLVKVFAVPLEPYNENRTAMVGNYQTRNTDLNTLLPAVYAYDTRLAKRYESRSFARSIKFLAQTRITIPLNKHGLSHGLSNGDRVTLAALELPSGMTSTSTKLNLSIGETYRVAVIPPADTSKPSTAIELYTVGDPDAVEPIRWAEDISAGEEQLPIKFLFGRAHKVKARSGAREGILRLGDTTPHAFQDGDLLTLVDVVGECGPEVSVPTRGESLSVRVVSNIDFEVRRVGPDGSESSLFGAGQPGAAPCEVTLFLQLAFPVASANRAKISLDVSDRFHFSSILNRYEDFVRSERDHPSEPKRIFPYVSPDVMDEKRCVPNCPWVRMSSRSYKDLLHHIAVRGRIQGFFAFNVLPQDKLNLDELERTQAHVRELSEVTRELHPFRENIRKGARIRADRAVENLNRLSDQQKPIVSASRYMDEVLVRVSRFGVRPRTKEASTGGAVQLRPFPEKPGLSFNLWGSPEGSTFLLRPDGTVRCGCGKEATRPNPSAAWYCRDRPVSTCEES